MAGKHREVFKFLDLMFELCAFQIQNRHKNGPVIIVQEPRGSQAKVEVTGAVQTEVRKWLCEASGEYIWDTTLIRTTRSRHFPQTFDIPKILALSCSQAGIDLLSGLRFGYVAYVRVWKSRALLKNYWPKRHYTFALQESSFYLFYFYSILSSSIQMHRLFHAQATKATTPKRRQ